jgi:hypothetical protein
MTTISTVAALIALALIAARVAHRSVLRYRCSQHINDLVFPGPADPTNAERRR